MKTRPFFAWGIPLFFVAACLVGGCGEGKSSGTNVNDTERPADVTGLTVTGVGDGYVSLSWNAATDNVGVAGYEVTVTELGETRDVGNVTSYTWSGGLVNGTSYTFSVVAYDASGNRSLTPDTATGTPQPPDTEPPSDVVNPSGTGGWHDPNTKDYVELNLWWTASASPDVSHYLLSISSDGGSTYTVLSDHDIGNVSTLTVPDPSGPVTSADLTPNDPFSIGNTYTVRVVTVDTSGNRSTGITFDVTPTESQDTTPPGAVRNLSADPEDQGVVLSWNEPLPVGDAASYRVYYRTPADDDVTGWTSWGTTTALTATVTGLTNGTLYEFMVCAVDGSGNEHPGGSTADRSDDTAGNKITAIPTSDSILCVPNIRGGVFREANFTSRDVVIMVATSQSGLLSTTTNTEIYYTLDGSAIDTNNFTVDATHGKFTFADSAVTEVAAGYLYAVTVDFDPSAAGVQQISDNTLRPDGSADHVVLKYLVKTPSDASRVYTETYLIYPDASAYTFRSFSGMREQRTGCTATYIEQGDTAGDVVFVGGSLAGTPLGTAERYRLAFEHFENVQAAGGSSSTMNDPRMDDAAVLLADGKTILVTGGFDPGDLSSASDGPGNRSMGLGSTELFVADSATDGFTAAPPAMDTARRFHAAVRLYSGKVLLTGGLNGETNLHASVTSPFTAANTDPSPSRLDADPDTLELPAGALSSSDIGAVVEFLSGSAVTQRGVLRSFYWDEAAATPHYVITIDGLVTDVNNGDSYRVINTATADAEYFTAAGANDTAADPAAMNYARYGHTATLLQDGTVFIAGGLYDYRNDPDDTFEYTCEIFDPVTETFTVLNNSYQLLSTTRFFHNAVLLKDGKVLITGGLTRGDYVFTSAGFQGASGILSSAELYDPASGSITTVGNMTTPRFMHSAVLLPSGKVLICGGYTAVTSTGVLVFDDTAEIYDPETRTFSATGKMLTPRGRCAAALVTDENSAIYGKVVVGGGANNTLAELYDENTGLFSATAHGVSDDRYIGAVSTPLADGTVLITGGQTNTYFDGNQEVIGKFLDTAEIYDTSLVKFSRTAGNMADRRRFHTATRLPDGTVLVAGGENESGGLTGAEIYDPAKKTFTATADMLEPRYKHTATLLPDGKVFICGGANTLGSLQSCEIYNPSSGVFVSAPSMSVPRYDHTATLLPNGWVLITGGEGIDSTSVEIYDSNAGVFLASPPVSSLLTGRDGHTAVQPAYAVGKARFTSGSTTVTGSDGTQFGLDDTNWTNADWIKPGDVIVCVEDGTPYVIQAIADKNTITLSTAYAGTSTDQKLTGGQAAGAGFEDYVILSQDVYIAGGTVTERSTEVFDFDGLDDEWPSSTPTDSTFVAGQLLTSGRYGHTMTSLATGRLLVTGGRNVLDGEYTTFAGSGGDFSDDTWSASLLDSWEWVFHTAFRLSNGTIILVRGHAAQVFHTK